MGRFGNSGSVSLLVLTLAILTATAARLAAASQFEHTGSCVTDLEQLPAGLADDKQKQIEQVIVEVHRKQRNVGLAATVLLRGQPVYRAALGYADLEHQVPVKSDTRFGVASVTKAFTGIALLKLWEAKKIDLDAPIQRYVPSFPEKPEGVITPRLLAAHLAGIRHWGNERTPSLYATHFNDVNDVLRLFQNDPLAAKPGTKYSYSSCGYNLLGAAIQSAAQMPFPRYVEETILRPLGLRSTQFDDVRRVIPNRARRYSFYDPLTFAESPDVLRVPDWDYSHNLAGGNMLATADDLAHFGEALVRPGFLSKASMEKLYRRTKTDHAESPVSFGWFIGEAKAARREIHITGSNPGVQAAVNVYPDSGLVVAVLSNTWGVGSRSAEMVSALPQRIASICLDSSP